MRVERRRRTSLIVLALVGALMALAAPASALPSYSFTTPVFGLGVAPSGALLVADFGSGVVKLTNKTGTLLVSLPLVTDVASLPGGGMWALTSGDDGRLYRVHDRTPTAVADITGFEQSNNPDEGQIDSNPFDLARLGRRRVLVADAAGNDVLIANRRGKLDWVATLPDEVVSTANAKHLAGCPNPPKDLADICDLPAQMPAEAVATSVAVGPDGAYYVTELKGFPAPLGESRIWRIEPGTRHAQCGNDPRCSVVADGFTSVIDLSFGPDGTAHVVELDEASWLAVEWERGTVGGTIDACDPATWTCTQEATDLTTPTAVAVKKSGEVYAVVSALAPGEAKVVPIS